LPKTLDALQNLMKTLFGISMTEYPLDRAERWDLSSPEDYSEATKLRKFLFSHSEQGDLGTLYLDLHPRESKYGHPAHYTVRCGCQRIQDQNNKDQYQLPIVALVCNLSSRTGAISHGEVETIFHEMGHAVHSLLSRTKYQHMSGTRAAMDFVETPSQFLEQFASNESLLRDAFGVPDDCVQALMKSKTKLSSIETQTQLMYALFDQLLFGAEYQSQDSASLFHRVHSELNLPCAEGTMGHARFGHLVTYGASYYGYLYSKGFAMELYRHVLQHGDGQDVWKKLLVYGGSKNPLAMLTDVIGRPPVV
jgi:mitochondrial intermediate peptidase